MAAARPPRALRAACVQGGHQQRCARFYVPQPGATGARRLGSCSTTAGPTTGHPPGRRAARYCCAGKQLAAGPSWVPRAATTDISPRVRPAGTLAPTGRLRRAHCAGPRGPLQIVAERLRGLAPAAPCCVGPPAPAGAAGSRVRATAGKRLGIYLRGRATGAPPRAVRAALPPPARAGWGGGAAHHPTPPLVSP